MTNIIQQSEMLKDVSDQRIQQEMRQPTGQFPLYLVSSEAKRRSDLRTRFKGEQAQPPQTTVQDDLLAMLARQTQRPGLPPAASQGLGGAAPQGGPAVPAPMGVPPVTQPRLPPTMPPQGSLGNVQGFAQGGMVRGFRDGGGIHFSPLERAAMAIKEKGISAYNLFKNPAETMGDTDIDPRSGERARVPVTYSPRIDPRGVMPLDDTEDDFKLSPKPTIRGITGTDPILPEDMTVRPQTVGEAAIGTAVSAQAANRKLLFPEWGKGDLARPMYPVQEGSEPEFISPTGKAVTVPSITHPDLVKIEDVPALVPGALPAAFTPKSEVDFDVARARRLAALRGEADPYAEQEKRLAAREADITGDAETNKWLALAKAGFETAGGTSQYALTNIGKGGVAGLADYAAGEKEISARQDRAFDARTALTGAKIQLDTARKSESDKYAQGLISKEERDNNVRKAEADHNMNVYKIQETTRQEKFKAESLTESRRYDAKVLQSKQKYQAELTRQGLQYSADLLADERKWKQADRDLSLKIRQREKAKADLLVKYNNDKSAYTDQERQIDREYTKDIALFQQRRKDLATDVTQAIARRTLEITEKGKTTRAAATQAGLEKRSIRDAEKVPAALRAYKETKYWSAEDKKDLNTFLKSWNTRTGGLGGDVTQSQFFSVQDDITAYGKDLAKDMGFTRQVIPDGAGKGKSIFEVMAGTDMAARRNAQRLIDIEARRVVLERASNRRFAPLFQQMQGGGASPQGKWSAKKTN